MESPRSTPAQRFVWCLYDFGNSAFPTVIITAVYALYFSQVVVDDTPPGRADQLWGLATSLGALLVFLVAPLLGTLADGHGWKRPMLIVHALLCAAATAGLAWTGAGTEVLAIVLVVLGLYAFEAGNVFYNAYLPELVDRAGIAVLSGRAWAFGYIGGLLCLLVVLGMTEFGLGVASVPLVVAVWFLLFTAPALWLLRDSHSRRSVATPFWERIRGIRQHRELGRFLLSLFFYMNALNTVYVFAVVFATRSLGFTTNESIILVIVLNVVAAPGAMLFARIADRTGVRASIALSLWLWLIVVVGSVWAAWPGAFESTTSAKTLFWGVAALASLCIGATQATSRTYVAALAPPGMSGEFFGFMALAGRASAVLGPWVFGEVSRASGGDQRWAVATIGGFFAIGLVLLALVREPVPGSAAGAGGE